MGRLLVACGFLAAAAAAVIDRTAVAVGNDVITETEILDDIRVVAFLNGEALDFSPRARLRAAERLVDQYLIRQEIRIALYDPPPRERAGRLLRNVKARFRGEEEYRAALQRYGITEQQLKDHLYWQLTAMRFVNLRFRAGLPERATDLLEELEEEARADRAAPGTPPIEPAPPPPAPDLDGELSVDEQLERWLKQARERTRVVYMKEAFQ